MSAVVRTRRPTAERRVEIADAALRIIATRGITALSTAALAAEIGVTGGALFRHFATRDAILDAVSQRVQELLGATMPDRALPGAVRLERFLDARAALIAAQPGVPRLVLSDQFALALPAASAARLRAAVLRTRALVTEAIVDGQRDGALRTDIAADAAAVIVLGALQMLALTNAVSGARAAQADGVRACLRALLAPAPKRRAPHKSRSRARASTAAPRRSPRRKR